MLALSLVFILGLSSSLLASEWTVNQNIKTPESVYYAPEVEQIFVSNINGGGTEKNNKGYISKLSKSGTVLESEWIKGLNAPKGMRSLNGILWVTDIDELVKIDIRKGKILKKFLRVMTVCQKLGVILESKVVQKLSLEKKFLINNGLLD